jgi:hypothetical protein
MYPFSFYISMVVFGLLLLWGFWGVLGGFFLFFFLVTPFRLHADKKKFACPYHLFTCRSGNYSHGGRCDEKNESVTSYVRCC